jgi:spore photoproduct lyase
MDHPVAIETMKRLKKAVIVKISHYKDVFCRPQQDFQLQKRAQKLILAVKDSNFLYKGPDICQNFGNSNFYYTSFLLNCIYNCDYCYLQGMYPSANIVAFVNIEDFFSAAEEKAAEHNLFLAVSYDTDLLAFEGIIPYSSMWAEFAAGHPQIKIEIRTKSANCMAVSNINPVENVTLAWTLSPQSVIDKYEPLTPSLNSRIKAVNKALARGCGCWCGQIGNQQLFHIYRRVFTTCQRRAPFSRAHTYRMWTDLFLEILQPFFVIFSSFLHSSSLLLSII